MSDPKTIDRQLARLSAERWELVDQITQAYNMIHLATDDRLFSPLCSTVPYPAVGNVSYSQGAEPTSGPPTQGHTDIVRRLEVLRADLFDLDETFSRIEAPFHVHPWRRVFVDQSGTIHSEPSCPGLAPNARLRWLPEASGDADLSAVGEGTSMGCIHCIPQLP